MGWNGFGTGEICSAVCALFWAVAVILFRKSGERASPVALNLFKDTVAFGLFVITLPVLGIPYFPSDQTAADWAVLALSGAIGIGVADTVFFACLNRIGAGRYAVLDCAYSPMVAVCSFFYLGDRIGPWLLLAMGLMLVAIILASWEPSSSTPLERRQLWSGTLLGLLSLALAAIGIVLAKPVLDRSNPWWATTIRLAAGMVLVIPQALWRGQRAAVARMFRPSSLWRVAIPSAVVGTYGAMIFWIAGVKYTATTVASVLNQLSTIFIVVLAMLFLKEKLTLRRAIAIVLALAGAVLSTW